MALSPTALRKIGGEHIQFKGSEAEGQTEPGRGKAWPRGTPWEKILDWDLNQTISAIVVVNRSALAVCGHQSSDDQFRELILPTIPDLVVTPSFTMMR